MLNKRIKLDYYSTIKKLSHKEVTLIYNSLNTKYDTEFLFSIIIAEKMNRERMSFLERILVFIFPKVVIFLDVSIGICQIKPSTAKLVVNLNDQEIIKLLLNPSVNIEIMCNLIEYYRMKHYTNEDTLNFYLTGKKSPRMNNELKIYHELTVWSSKNRFYQKFVNNSLN